MDRAVLSETHPGRPEVIGCKVFSQFLLGWIGVVGTAVSWLPVQISSTAARDALVDALIWQAG